jgi:hypothetical protein
MNRVLLIPLAVAVAVHLALAILVEPRFESDSAIYRVQAEALLERGASLDAAGQPETRVTPGYALFLAVFLAGGLGYTGAIVAQHLIWIALVAAAMWLALRASGSSLAAGVAGFVTAIDLPAIHSSVAVLSETLAAAILVAAVSATLMAMRANRLSTAAQWSAAAGILAGATALVRPIAIVLGVPLAIAVVIGADRRWRLTAAAVLLAAFAVLPAFWIARNAREAGVATLSSLAGINLLHYRAAATLAIRDPGGIDANLMRRRDELEQRACRDLEAAYQRPCATLTWAERSGEYAETAWPIILGDPVATARQAARALAMILFGGGANLLSELTGVEERVARLLLAVYTVPLAVLAVLGIPYWWTRDRAFTCLVLLTLAYMIGLALGAEAYSRFRVPVIALYAILCGGGVEQVRRVLGKRARVEGRVLSERAKPQAMRRESKD